MLFSSKYRIVWSSCLVFLTFDYRPSLAQNECDPAGHVIIDNARRSTQYKLDTDQAEPALCDMHLTQGWYRFKGEGIDLELPTDCVPKFQCGTVVPVWMDGSHPQVDEGVQVQKICGNFQSGRPGATSCCEMAADIAVRNCSGFYVYYLRPTPSCPVAYCAGDRPSCPVGQWSKTGYAPCMDAHPPIREQPEFTGPHVTVDSRSFTFECEVKDVYTNPAHKFEVEWTIEGKVDRSIPSVILSKPQVKAVLDGKNLRGSINKQIGCQIRSFYQGNIDHKSHALKSKSSFYAAIEVYPGRLEFESQDSEKVITVRSTVPILCDYAGPCCLDLVLNTTFSDKLLIPRGCTYQMCSHHWVHTKGLYETEIPVVSTVQMASSTTQVQLSFNRLSTTGGPYQGIFDGVILAPVNIEVRSKNVFTCKAETDPHITPLEANKVLDLYRTGDYIFYENPARKFMVQIRTWPCTRPNSGATCICGVVVRERNDVIKVNQCNQQPGGATTSPTIDIPRAFTEGTRVMRSSSGSTIVVLLASGSEVEIVSHRWYFNVVVRTPGSDRGQAQGLCGTNDGNPYNDLKYPNGHIEALCPASRCQPNNFYEAWRVKGNDSLFVKYPGSEPSNLTFHYCQCSHPNPGQPGAALDCSFTGRKKEPENCNNCPNSKIDPTGGKDWEQNKRQVTYEDVDEVDMDIGPAMPGPPLEGVNDAIAKDDCLNIMKKSALWKVCSNDTELVDRILSNCKIDYLVTKSKMFLESALEDFTSSCKSKAASDISMYVKAADGTDQLRSEFTEYICSTVCLQHGSCTKNGDCLCHTGWTGAECHIDSTKGPQLAKIRSGPLCDLGLRPCLKIFSDVTNLGLEKNLTCRVQRLDVADQPIGSAEHSSAHFLSAFRLACDLPVTTTTNQRYAISVSNDGQLWGNALTLHVFDSTCLECDITGCRDIQDSCNIQDKCYRNRQTKPDDVTYVCDPNRNRNVWSLIPHPTQGSQMQMLIQVSGPDPSGQFTCTFQPLLGLSGLQFRMFWLLDHNVVKGNHLASKTFQGTITQKELQGITSGKLQCQVETGNRSAFSHTRDL